MEGYIERFERARIFVLGDIMLDRYFWGEVDRISPEAPVPVVRVTRKSARLGGAANVAANLRAIGVNASLAGIMGDDHAGDEAAELMREIGIGTSHVRRERDVETTEKVRIIAQSQQVVRADFETDAAHHDERAAAFARLAEEAHAHDALVISDYGKGVLARDYLPALIKAWRAEGKPVLVDPHIRHFRWYGGASIVTPNTKEAASYFDATVSRDELFLRLGFRMCDELSLDALLITRGEEGMTLFTAQGEQVNIPTVAKEVYDVTGAGDTVISVLAAALASGAPLLEAVIMANQAAGEVVKEIGTSVITPEDLVRAFA